MKRPLYIFARDLLESTRNILPIVAVVAFFQLVVLRQPPPNLTEIIVGLVAVVLGLALFLRGLQMGPFPIGEAMAVAFARKGSVLWLTVFAFALGFSTALAEPALIAVSGEAAQVAVDSGMIDDNPSALARYALGLRLTVATAVGAAIVIGVVRIIKGWPLIWLIVGGYLGILVMTVFAPPEIVPFAYDSGAVTTSSVTVPLVAALGVGLASSIRGRNPMIDGFGLIAFASLTPIVFVMIYGMLS